MRGSRKIRTIIFYKDYFSEFFTKQKSKVKDKIIWTLELIEELTRVPESYLKHMENTNGLYGIRIQQEVIYIEYSAFLIKVNWLF